MPEPTIRSFTQLVGLLSKGRFSERLDEELQAAIASLEGASDGKGKATLTVAIEIAYQDGRIDVKPTVKAKLPEEKAFGTTPFWTHEGALSVQHPSQIDMFGGPRVADDRARDRA